MSGSLKQRIQDDIKTAMRSKDKALLGTLRLISSAIKQREVDERIEVNDIQLIEILDKMVKQRRDSIGHYQAAGRDDLVAQESFELDVLQNYLPQPLSEAELNALIDTALAETAASSPSDLGKVMAHLKPLVQGRADMRALSSDIKKRLSA
ncbi:GatB/YqeY domain-containing protein [Thioflexithrix psekupsensis]|uniref:Glutamyl-tRNA amidotransferase n=1 Tax=Thioflexithrix psekupsensis TaxID=1570016 RepID=A0A251X8Y4_9GAMM|nr:GatB/YqeY domain-containing protein [Thioflexithrix psekupsensis]OUD14528.1 glutamyl-tRNA amidotransferase [Thioflexithrix psekupsensis]